LPVRIACEYGPIAAGASLDAMTSLAIGGAPNADAQASINTVVQLTQVASFMIFLGYVECN
jgi:hypothetical protein